MTGPFIELSEIETGKPLWVNTALVTCIAPHGRSGSYVFFSGGADRFEVEETPAQVAVILEAAGVAGNRPGEGA